MTVVIAGGVVAREAFELAEKYFGKMSTFDALGYKKVELSQTKPQVFIKQKKTEQAHIAIGFRTAGSLTPDRYPLAVLSAILGGGASSRLFHEVREKRGLAYFIRTNSEHYKDNGVLSTFAGLDPQKIEEAIKVIMEEYKKATEGKFGGENELRKAKEFLKGHLVLELEDSRAVAGFYGQQELLEDKIENVDEVIKKIEAVSKDKLQAVAKKYFIESNLNLAIIGDFHNTSRFESLLRF